MIPRALGVIMIASLFHQVEVWIKMPDKLKPYLVVWENLWGKHIPQEYDFPSNSEYDLHKNRFNCKKQRICFHEDI